MLRFVDADKPTETVQPFGQDVRVQMGDNDSLTVFGNQMAAHLVREADHTYHWKKMRLLTTDKNN